jgi:hypothetical protein
VNYDGLFLECEQFKLELWECNYNKECQNCGKTGHPAICCLHKKIVFLIEEGSADEIPGVNSPDVAVVNEPTEVIMGGPQADPPQDAGRARRGRNSNAVVDTALDEDLEQQAVAEPETQDAPPKMRMVAHNAWNRKQPKKYVPRMQGNKNQVALIQIGTSKMSMAFSQMSVKKALETLKATVKKWGKDAEESVEVEKHRRDFDRESVLQGVSNDRGDTLLSSEMRYEYAHLEAAKKERNPKLVLPLQYKDDVVKDEKDRAFILVHWLTALYGTMIALLLYYKMFINSLKSKRFKLNPDDICVTNKQMKGKQKLSTHSSNESELVGGDGIMPIVVWSRNLLMAGYGVAQNIFLQDNRGTMLMEYLRGDHDQPFVLGAEQKGKTLSGKRTRHINIRYFLSRIG